MFCLFLIIQEQSDFVAVCLQIVRSRKVPWRIQLCFKAEYYN